MVFLADFMRNSFSSHLTSILAHSLSLCSAVTPNPILECDESSSAESSPRSSISSDSCNVPPSLTYSSGDSAQQSVSNFLERKQRLPSLPSITPSRRMALLDFLSTWNFDANQLDQDELCECACLIFECCMLMDGVDLGGPDRSECALLNQHVLRY